MFSKCIARFAAITIAALVFLPVSARADVNNGGFETGSTVFWGSSPNVTVVTNTTDSFGNLIGPCSGNFFAQLVSSGINPVSGDALLDLPAGTLSAAFPSITNGSVLYQNIKVNAGATVFFCYDFIAGDYNPFDDVGFFSVAPDNASQPIYLSSVNAVGDFNSTGWIQDSYTFTAAGNYTLGFGVYNRFDTINNSRLLVDDVRIVDVPEPGAVAFGVLAMGSLLGLIARRRRA